MPDWIAGLIIAVVAFGFAAAVAYGRRRQPCAVDPRIKEKDR
jgi:hypothetical protein